jgi:hypothetical protein
VDDAFSANSTVEVSSITSRALSLKVLQERLKTHHNKGSYPQELAHLAGLNRIIGFVIDEARHDIVLVGEVDESLPPLYLEDFVIALRNAKLKYAELRGNTYYYSNPGCSIDPDTSAVQKLYETGNQLFSTSSVEEVEETIKKWHSICRSPQQVRVMGIPFDTRFACIMVTADYDMKSLVDGSDSLGIPGFLSLTDMTINIARESIKKGKPVSLSFSMNRFWFYPGENRYLEDDGAVIIKQCPVVLLSEEEFLSKRGGIVGRGQPDPLAHDFTEKFTSRYAAIAAQRPVYTELENLFRFVALAKIIDLKSADAKAGLDLSYLMDEYRVQMVPVKRQLEGRSSVKGFEHRRDYNGGYQIARLWLPSCGGVSIEIEVSQENFFKDPADHKPSEIREKVLDTRPSPEVLFWDFFFVL